jgi:hypothetical protein
MALVQANRTLTGTLIAGVVTTIQCLTPVNGFRVFNRDPVSPLYYRFDNVDPVVGGDGSFYLAPNSFKWITNLPDNQNPEMRLISAGIGLAFIVEADFTE